MAPVPDFPHPLPPVSAMLTRPALLALLAPELSCEAFARTLDSALEAEPVSEAVLACTAVLDRFLQGVWTDADQPGKRAQVTDALARLLGPRGQGNMVLAQINPAPGDLAGNARKILAYMQAAEAIGADMVVFPELALMGYPVRDVITRHPFLVAENTKWLSALAKRAGKTRALLGFVEARHPEQAKHAEPRAAATGLWGKPYYNALAILGEGRVEGIVRKALLPTYNEFNDDRTFAPSPVAGILPPDEPVLTAHERAPVSPTIHGHRYGVTICEDTWSDPDFFRDPWPLHGRDPVAELLRSPQPPEVLLNVSASPSRSRKEQLKHNLLSHLARKHGVPYVYVNQVGAVDETSYDGASRVYDASGQLRARAAAFREQFLVVNAIGQGPLAQAGPLFPLPEGLEQSLSAAKHFDADDEADLGRLYESLLQGLRDYFRKTGFGRAVLGLSGGLDSAVTAVLLADALGPAQVVALHMPTGLTPDENREDAFRLAENLGIGFVEVPIGDIRDAFGGALSSVRPAFSARWGRPDAASTAAENVQAMTRATLLRLVGNDYGALPVATSDKSELYRGYATVNGDMSGAIAPLADVTKTRVRALARWMNQHRPTPAAIPPSVIDRPPGADLKRDAVTGRLVTAEDELGPYAFADEVIWRIEALGQGKADLLAQTLDYERRHTVTPEDKRRWLDVFFRRMAAAVFKWWVLPPGILVEGNGAILRTDYDHPITANRIVWEGHSPEAIEGLLDGPV